MEGEWREMVFGGVRRKAAYSLTITILLIGVLWYAVNVKWTEASEAYHTLTITATTGGTTHPPPGTYSYLEGTIVSVYAIPNLSYVLDHWEVDGYFSGSENQITVQMNYDHALHAVFRVYVYDVNITAYCGIEMAIISVPITMDGNPTGYNTPHTFTGLTGIHTFTVPSTDPNGHPFTRWSNGDIGNTTMWVIWEGTYIAYYGMPLPSVGGYVIPVDKLGLLAPYIGLASTILIALTATIIYVKRFKNKRQKQ
ncbi:MAG: hypothetical protein QXZ59_04840 [Nitrososphaeria archaeon]